MGLHAVHFSSKVLRQSDGLVFDVLKQVITFMCFKTQNGSTSFVIFCYSLRFFLLLILFCKCLFLDCDV